jgi:hypothetical protein
VNIFYDERLMPNTINGFPAGNDLKFAVLLK